MCFSSVVFMLASAIFLFTLLIFLIQNMVVFFYQERSGLHHQPYKFIKFRTMIDGRNAK
jgi:lipopolysaccharide/colanic/teichoic acid biosynthesis glycosyltransferase